MPPPLGRRIFFSLVPFGSCSQVIFSGELCLIFYSWCSMLGQRTNATHTGCDFFRSNTPYPLAQLIAHMSSAVCTCVTVPLDSHMWTERTNSLRLPRGALEGHWIFMLARSRGRMVGIACTCTMVHSLVWLYMYLCAPCVSRAARRLTMATEPTAMCM